MTKPAHKYLTVPEVADQLRVDPVTVRRWCTAGYLKAGKAGNGWRITQAAVDELLASYRRSTPLASNATALPSAPVVQA